MRISEESDWVPAAVVSLGFILNAAIALRGRRAESDLILTACFALALILTGARYWRPGLALPPVGSAVGLAFEVVGVRYGIPFGRYSYSEFGPEILEVPVPVVIAWGIYLFVCYSAASSLTRRVWARVALASAMMVALDLAVDPVMVAQGAWSWEEGGPWFGIPLSNFLGWFTVSAVALCLFTKIFGGAALPPRTSPMWRVAYLASFVPLMSMAQGSVVAPALLAPAVGAALLWLGSHLDFS
ncbi:MAG: carotenoid biosynthesis protein [Candidatus Korarchaeota archaeon]|nr:carotenoid biosynthesis protein [Candidatus Korarchaeota archaeon]